MTEQLMDNISNEEHERLISISEHAIAPPLSLVAQAVLDAIESRIDRCTAVAAVLRVVATQVTPLSTNLRQNKIRYELLIIADELEGQ
jgi:hypothetical protein